MNRPVSVSRPLRPVVRRGRGGGIARVGWRNFPALEDRLVRMENRISELEESDARKARRLRVLKRKVEDLSESLEELEVVIASGQVGVGEAALSELRQDMAYLAEQLDQLI